ncbi:helix-turn-helix transcriptional regulator [Grimontia hollisae]|uniref:helix-turn-helix domain-containing protein n=1 Tax=Grimontia hollisae TaxID=673 RepID=UPI0023DA282E|nr:helix-turn-helix transcriptional regulator [Grimontia hollisae]MDF2185447.1 helix-turn-helix transcriptional regulator [Grimontia hollisae]
MSYLVELLDEVKIRHDIASDYALAQKLGVARNAIYQWRKNLNSADWETIFKLADLLQLDDQNVVYKILEEKYDNPRLINTLRQGERV